MKTDPMRNDNDKTDNQTKHEETGTPDGLSRSPEYRQALEGLANRLKVRVAPGPQCEMGSQSPRIARYVRESLK